MPVKLISYTKTADESQSLLDVIAYCARVSNPANQNNTQTNEKLVRYLIKNNHWSPLEMVNVCLEIETTRDIARQILRHRSFSFQEFSQRYAVADLGFECKEARLQDKKNRQNSIKTNNTDLEQEWTKQQNSLAEHAQTAYTWALENGIAKEQARAVLPEGNTLTTIYMAGTLRSWIHYCGLRGGHGTQLEHTQIANLCWSVIETHFPDVVKAVNDARQSD